MGKSDKTLGRALGYLTLITLIARSGNLYALLNGNFSLDSFRRAMEHAKGFRWEQPGTKDGSVTYNKLMLGLTSTSGRRSPPTRRPAPARRASLAAHTALQLDSSLGGFLL